MLRKSKISRMAILVLCVTALIAGTSTLSAAQDLVGYWSFDDGTASDGSSYGNDGAVVGAKAGVMTDIEAGKQVVGQPAIDRRDALRSAMAVRDLPKILKQVKKLLKLNKIED